MTYYTKNTADIYKNTIMFVHIFFTTLLTY